jgi:hypothetical protein
MNCVVSQITETPSVAVLTALARLAHPTVALWQQSLANTPSFEVGGDADVRDLADYDAIQRRLV